MAMSRYSIHDAYTVEELRREYQASDAKGRIRLLRKLYRTLKPPYEIALLAVEDPNVEVRQWLARNGWQLDYREEVYRETEESEEEPVYNEKGELVGWRCTDETEQSKFDPRYRYPDRDLEGRLRKDPDPFVRACLRENSHVYSRFGFWKQWFAEATHLERLALVRNPGVDEQLVERIFDPEDKELQIDLGQRKELLFALLTNRDFIHSSRELSWDDVRNPMHFAKLWQLASKWPADSGVSGSVYMHVGADDDDKASVYQNCTNPWLRRVILGNCNKSDKQTIELGMKDTDENCRTAAEELNERIHKDKEGRSTWELEELFDQVGGRGKFAEDKINIIWKRLLVFQVETRLRLQRGLAEALTHGHSSSRNSEIIRTGIILIAAVLAALSVHVVGKPETWGGIALSILLIVVLVWFVFIWPVLAEIAAEKLAEKHNKHFEKLLAETMDEVSEDFEEGLRTMMRSERDLSA